MPAIRNTPLKSQSTTPPVPTNQPQDGAKTKKSTLLNHVLKFGEKDWKVAVPGKTGKECQEQWKKTLLPYIRRVSGL